MVFSEAWADGFSTVCPGEPFTPAVSVDIDGRVCEDVGGCGLLVDGSHGR